jgi:hypothetical protein
MTVKAQKRFTKATLPSKMCVTCGRPFAWRKKWARDWDNVKFCSDRCRIGKVSKAATDRDSGDDG